MSMTPSSAHSQVIVASSDPVCSTCAIRLDSVAVLGGMDDPVSLDGSAVIVRSPAGHYFAAPIYSPGQIAVYDRAGRFLRAVGRQGEGPGELSAVDLLEPARGDSVVAFGPGRAIVFPGPGGGARDISLRMSPRAAVVFDDGRFVLHGYDGNRGAREDPLHLFEADGVRRSSFGASESTGSSGDFATRTRSLAPSSTGGSFWVARPNAYEIERWDTAGTRQLTIRRTTSWFSPWDAYPVGAPYQARPPSLIIDVIEDGHQRLWVLSYVADPDWRPYRPGGREARVSAVAQAGVFDSVLDVIDPDTGEVLASTRLDVAAGGFAAPDMLYIHDEDANGLVRIRLYSLQLAGER